MRERTKLYELRRISGSCRGGASVFVVAQADELNGAGDYRASFGEFDLPEVQGGDQEGP
jgi:hypothetical protein